MSRQCHFFIAAIVGLFLPIGVRAQQRFPQPRGQ
jgi:hypothetical protein